MNTPILNSKKINQCLEQIETIESGYANFSDILEILSDDETFGNYITKDKNEKWIVDFAIKITESQGNELRVTNLIFSDIVFTAPLDFCFLNIEFEFDCVEFLSTIHFMGISQKAILFLSFLGEIKSSKKFEIFDCTIEGFVYGENTIDFEILFNHCIFNTSLSLKGKLFSNRVSICYCTFIKSIYLQNTFFYEKILFLKSLFQDNLYFDYSSFFKETLFYEVEFERRVSFYHAFCHSPLLLVSSTFKDVANFLNLHCGDSFPKMQEKIAETDFNFLGANLIENIASWNKEAFYRDSFRLIKNTLAKDGNILDASNYYKAELYCKETELANSKPKPLTRDWIDKMQLWFYRLTSDHHTDLAKIFNNVIMLIALFGIFSFCSVKYGEKHLDYERQYFGSVQTSAIDLSVRKTSHSLTKSELKAEKQDLQNFSWNQNNFSESFSIAILCLAFVVSFVCLISLDCLKNKFWIKARNILSYLSVFGVLVLKPTLLLPFVGRFLESSPTASFPAIQSLSVVYCILMFLMLFSLQKTARKNSIIPS